MCTPRWLSLLNRSRGFGLVFFLFVISVVPLARPAATADADTGRDWGIANTRVEWRLTNDGAAWQGACYGMTVVRETYQQLGLDRQRPLRDATNPAGSAGSGNRAFLEEVAAVAQRYALKGRNVDRELYGQTTDPNQVDRSLLSHDVSPEHPQRLILTNEKAVGGRNMPGFLSHAVDVDRREERNGEVVYTVHNPNYPGARSYITLRPGDDTVSPYEGFDTIRHDANPLPRANRLWIEALVRGATQRDGRKYIPVWKNDGDLPLSPEEYDREMSGRHRSHTIEPPVPSSGLNGAVSASGSDNVGGVRLYFDPVIVDSSADSEAGWELMKAAADRLAAGDENFLVRKGGTQEMQVVRLSGALRDGTGTVGGLTRIGGFARGADGEIYVLGAREAGRTPIRLDVLTVALRALWKQGRRPAVSLDPNPDDVFGPQQVRLEELSATDHETEFARVMLDADYEMKRIMLGEDRLAIPGFQSSYELLCESRELPAEEFVRYWLYPRETRNADVYAVSSHGAELCRFDSGVSVLTETMKQAGEVLIGTGKKDPLAERAALLFTRYFDDIAAQKPIFAELSGLFDAAKLAAVLRVRNVHSSVLDAVAARPVARVAIRRTYAGIGPKIVTGPGIPDDVLMYVGGGCESSAGTRGADVAPVDDLVTPDTLRRLVQSKNERSQIRVRVPSQLRFTPARSREMQGGLEQGLALDDLTAGRPMDALRRLNAVVATDPTSAPARALRAISRLATGDFSGAKSDADYAASRMLPGKAVRSLVRLCLGDGAGSLSDISVVCAAQPDQLSYLSQKAYVEAQLLQFGAATRDLTLLARRDPLNREVDVLRQDMRLFHRIGDQRARAYVRARLALPWAVQRGFEESTEAAQRRDGKAAIAALTHTLNVVQTFPVAMRSRLSLEERCWAALAEQYSRRNGPGDGDRVRRYLDQLTRRHPTWPTPYLFRIGFDNQLTGAEAIRFYRKALSLRATDDILEMEFLGRSGVEPKSLFGFVVLSRAFDRPEDAAADLKASLVLVQQVRKYTPPGPATAVLDLLEQVLRLAELRKSGTLGPEGQARFEKVRDRYIRLPLWVPPPPVRPDLVSLLGLIAAFPHKAGDYLSGEGPNHADADRFFARFAVMIDADWSTLDTVEQAARISLNLHRQYAEYLAAGIRDSAPIRDLQRKLREGNITLPQALSALDQEATRVADGKKSLPPLSRIMLRAMMLREAPGLVPDASRSDVEAAVLAIEDPVVRRLVALPKGPVQMRTASLWLEDECQSITNRAPSPEAAVRRITTYHTLATRLRLKVSG